MDVPAVAPFDLNSFGLHLIGMTLAIICGAVLLCGFLNVAFDVVRELFRSRVSDATLRQHRNRYRRYTSECSRCFVAIAVGRGMQRPMPRSG
jgi:dsRNA-specific ribonuclease